MPLFRRHFVYQNWSYMSEKQYITASDIGLYTFCPRAWALKQLDYESDRKWEMEKGIEFHEKTGEREIRNEIKQQPLQKRRNRQIQIISVLIVILLLCLLSAVTALILK